MTYLSQNCLRAANNAGIYNGSVCSSVRSILTLWISHFPASLCCWQVQQMHKDRALAASELAGLTSPTVSSEQH